MTQGQDKVGQRRAVDKHFTILCIDDESVNLKILASIFKEHYKVVACKSAHQGLKIALDIIPDLILLDVLMPEENGFELIQSIKQEDKIKHIPVIFITGLQSAEDEEKGLTLGACDYIQKPFNYGIVRARVNTHLEIIRQRELLERFANFDSLTELPNRRKWEKDIKEQWIFAIEAKQGIVIGIADVDCFKLYNDTYGHQMGDIVLRKVANALRRVLYEYHGDIYRCGGEEFYFYLPVNKKNNIQTILAECIEQVHLLNIQHSTSIACSQISVSIGAAQISPTYNTALESVIKKADDKLYQVKNSTRNAIAFTEITSDMTE
ncbi:GGDEF domain-containing response regulator [Thalassotalea profundi]|uniref:diguanylate cyclase n=1 Tax=Thalassotalea profundi TaxID=2036687 RepID=A0ABQ3IZ06_9GAMM|nr:diguanylate cyclase [Thalassotalea profundi]GHE97449.1 diguanylate cyclase response regulator [Thalassotalea profundi]